MASAATSLIVGTVMPLALRAGVVQLSVLIVLLAVKAIAILITLHVVALGLPRGDGARPPES